MLPLIAITGNYADDRLQLLPGYFRSIEAAGGIAVVIPPQHLAPGASLPPSTLALLSRIDGILLSGGADVNPLLCGEEPSPALGGINPIRDHFELSLIREAAHRQIPMFGICRGIQMLAVALGGSIHQDLKEGLPGAQLVKHSQDAPREEATHTVSTAPASLLRRLLGERLAVNSFHHQAVRDAGPALKVTARAADGVIEAVESSEGKSIFAVQWHPECFILGQNASMAPLFEHFVSECKSYRCARELHRRILTLDSHCDTPIFFAQGVDLERRDPKLLVDFPKMREGGLDSTIMVAYIPQGPLTEEGRTQAHELASTLLAEIKTRVERAPGVALASTPQELVENKKKGLLSVMRGIENGYAIGEDLSLLERYRREGLVYITLCHNGDNDLCDSARRSLQTHGGLSQLGREAVREMNRVGLMVDLSHAAETSFYDALTASRLPIVCSHASSRAICNHERNLTDDQLRALAAKGGVAQVTFYNGFLRLDGGATIDDAVRHLLHMISVAGISHVGIGTDFDGDGGVPGLASASELINFTRRLQAEGLTDDDLAKVWGGNFLRVMQQVQSAAEC